MKIKLDSEALKIINFFQNICRCDIIDCLNTEEKIYFVVGKGQYGIVVGKNGEKIRTAEKIFKKPIKIFEYSENKLEFLKNLIPESKEIEIIGNVATVKLDNVHKAKIIGRSGSNIKNLKKLANRIHEIQDIKIK